MNSYPHGTEYAAASLLVRSHCGEAGVRSCSSTHSAEDEARSPQGTSYAAAAAVQATSHPSGVGDGSDRKEAVLFDAVLRVATRLQRQGEVVQPLGVCVKALRVGPERGASRSILVRVTDPQDPFLLFQVQLREDDYGALKQKLELIVDFNGFPAYLVNMLKNVARGESTLQATFSALPPNSSVGTFRVIETNAYKTVEHISLSLAREGDAGQKQYLAEQFLHFQEQFLRCRAEQAEDGAHAEGLVDELRAAKQRLEEEVAHLREELKRVHAEGEKALLTSLHDLQETQKQQHDSLREGYEARLREEQQRASDLQRRFLEDIHRKDSAVEQLHGKVGQLESAEARLQSHLRTCQDKLAAQEDELTQLRRTVDDLRAYKNETSAAMSENAVNYASLAERLRGALGRLKAREEELESLRESNRKQERYIHSLSDQNERLARQSESQEANLGKAHHIIATQLQRIKDAKERYAIASDRLNSQQSLLSERDLAVQRLKDELAAATERVQTLQGKNVELREQLQQTDDARERLAQEVKNGQAALLHLQRSTSVGGRHWGVFGSGVAGGHAPRSSSGLSTFGSGGAPTTYTAASAAAFDAGARVVLPTRADTAGDVAARTRNVDASAGATKDVSPDPAPTDTGEQARKHVSSDTRTSAGLSATRTSATTGVSASAPRQSSSSPPFDYAARSFFPAAGAPAASTRASAYF